VRRSWVLFLALLLVVPSAVLPQSAGQLSGVVTGKAGRPLPAVAVVIEPLGVATVSDGEGRYRLEGIPAGEHAVTFSLGEHVDVARGVVVTAGEGAILDRQMDWEVSVAETITVFSASRRLERVVDAPAAVTVISQQEIERTAATGQLPKLLEFTPGAEITQSGLYDFNLNTRGFNSSLTRRVPTLVDGRDPSVPFLMSQDWASLAAMEDLASAELVRGPSSALYGANAFNGVLNLTTRQPKLSQGGTLRLSGGELSTRRADLRFSNEIGADLFLKAMGSYTRSDDFYQSRCLAGTGTCPAGSPAPEYPGLPLERVPLALDEDIVGIGTVRLDKHFLGSTQLLTVEGGYSTIEGPVVQSGGGRIQILDSTRTWGRFNYNTPHFNLLGYHNESAAPEQLGLSTGANFVVDSTVTAFEAQGHTGFAGSKGQVVAGASYREEDVDTEGTATAFPVGGDRSAVFAQVDYSFNDAFTVVVASRYDESSLHESQLSPKLGLVFSPSPDHTLRLTYNEAFQSPNYSELYLQAPTVIRTPAGPVGAFDLSAIENALCTPFGVSCGFTTPTAVLVLGNENLKVEEIETWEVGYAGIFGGRAFLTADYYRSRLDDFVTDLLPNPSGTTNPAFGPYQPPAGHPAPQLLLTQLQAALGPLYAFLSQNDSGASIFALASYTNAGRADTQGVDLGLDYYVSPAWTVDASYSWFDFELQEAALGDRVEANAPEHKLSVGLTYSAEVWDASLSYRWSDGFPWAAGLFVGDVPAYDVVSLDASYFIGDRWSLGLNVSNLLDDEHYEAFGGDLLGRRALVNVAYRWPGPGR
jgi:outer membrane receptor for ferrienterochelin and colicins